MILSLVAEKVVNKSCLREGAKGFLLRSGIRQANSLLLPFLFNIVLEVLASAIRQIVIIMKIIINEMHLV